MLTTDDIAQYIIGFGETAARMWLADKGYTDKEIDTLIDNATKSLWN